MDLSKNGKLLYTLRKAKGMTQKDIADRLGIEPKTVSKWETGHGFPDVSTISALADILDVSEKTILSGNLKVNFKETGNIRRMKFYVCPDCGSFMQGVGNCATTCCSKQVAPLKANAVDDKHFINISVIEDDYYVEFDHEMTKEHYVSFVTYVGFDRTLTIKLYPEQDASARFPKMNGGKLYFYCTAHGLFELKL